tara:strand:+ start:7669 stop:8337 length:669 start_codon:yes stop_codon:yes gene_type:complete
MTEYTYKLAIESDEIKLRKELFKDIDLDRYLNQYMLSDTLSSYINITNEHYHLLAYISTLVDNSIIIDSGTHRGGSAMALSYNQSNNVHTYDIETYKGGIENNVQDKPSNVKSNPSSDITELIKTEKDHVLNSTIFFLDINHEGPDEMKIFEFLLSNNYKGILILDDIHINSQMEDVWNYIQLKDVMTYDVTKYGNCNGNAGTGIVLFNKSHTCIDIFNELK